MFFADVRIGDDTYYKRNGDSIQIHFPGDNKNNSANYPKITAEDVAKLYNEWAINIKHKAIVYL